MGAQSFIHTIESESARNGFVTLTEDATMRYGNGAYNGSINTCSMGRCKRSYDVYSEKNEREAYRYIESVQNGEKWYADYIDLGVAYYLIRTVKKVNKEYTAVYRQKFVVVDYDGKMLHTADTKPEADKKAIELRLQGKPVMVKKMQVKLSGNDVVAEFKVEEKRQKTKPNLKQADNRVVIPIHKYIFFGWASC